MIRSLLLFLTLIFFLATPMMAQETPQTLKGVETVSSDQVKKWLDDGKEMFVLDPRKPSEYNDGHIPEAASCQVNTEKGLGDDVITKAVTFLEKCAGLKTLKKDHYIVTYCNAET